MSTALPPPFDVETELRPTVLCMTEAEYENWHDDSWTGAWVDGKVEPLSPVSNVQAQLQVWFTQTLGLFAERHRHGEIRGPDFPIRIRRPRQ